MYDERGKAEQRYPKEGEESNSSEVISGDEFVSGRGRGRGRAVTVSAVEIMADV